MAAPWGVLGAMLVIAVIGMVPPTVVSSDADPAEFSAERAFAHVAAIADQPRPIGSSGSAEARDYLAGQLTSMGLEPSLPSITVPDYYRAGREVDVIDIVARIEGTDSTGAILLMAHYDTLPDEPGANDNAVAVGAVIETARAILAGPPLRNDVIVLLTDGEEPAPRYGSTAFVEHDPLFPTVRLVVNLEAIGVSGVSQLTEVFGNEGALISHYASAVSHPAVWSVLDDFSELIGGSNTDISPFRDRGVAGFEFAYFQGSSIYHLPGDDVASVHRGSLQHHGTHTLGIARHFGDLDLATIEGEGQEVFFTLFGRVVIHYPAWLGIVLIAVAGLLLAVSLWLERSDNRVWVRRVLPATGWLLLGGLGAGVLVAVVWWVLVAGLWGTAGPGSLAAAGWMILLIGIAIGATVPVYRWIARRLGAAEVGWAAIVGWWVLGMIVSLAMPGAGYLFLWPALTAVVVLAFRLPSWVALGLIAAPAFLLADPVGRHAVPDEHAPARESGVADP